MPRNRPRVVLAGKTQRERRKQRAGIRLKDFTISARTRARYEAAVSRILPFLEAQESLADLDGVVCEWIELQWCRGESLGHIADALSGIHFFRPDLKGCLRQGWRMFKSWRQIEAPQRAPPLTWGIVTALIARAVEKADVVFAAIIGLAFHCLLRTGEFLALQYKDLELSSTTGICSLLSSKSGLRTGTEEAVAIRDPLVLNLLRTAQELHQHCPGQRLWPHSAQSFRDRFRSYLSFFRLCHLGMKPYSLRRGGATFLLQEGVPLDVILLRGRWKSLAVARIYLQDGLSQIPHLRISKSDAARLSVFSAQCPLTALRPC